MAGQTPDDTRDTSSLPDGGSLPDCGPVAASGTMPADTRGIVDPAAMVRLVDFDRYPPGDALDGLVAWLWSVAWDLPDGACHRQDVLNHPVGHISIGTIDEAGVPLDPPQGRVYGVTSGLSHRSLTVAGWTVAARTSVGGLGVLLDRPASTATDAKLSLGDALSGLDGDALVHEVNAIDGNAARVEHLRDALRALVDRRARALVAEAREVAAVAEVAERDRSVCRAEQLAATAGVSLRTLQRLFDVHVGVSPSYVIRRWRIIEATETASRATIDGTGWRGWAAVAAELGYADQAHLSRDFRRHLGTSPSAYLARIRRSTTEIAGGSPGAR